jgi:hypothetical protein
MNIQIGDVAVKKASPDVAAILPEGEMVREFHEQLLFRNPGGSRPWNFF